MKNIQCLPIADQPVVLSKNSIGQIRLAVREYGGHVFADLRVYFKDADGEFKPSKKGLAVAPHLWPQFINSLSQLEEELERRGLLQAELEEEEAV